MSKYQKVYQSGKAMGYQISKVRDYPDDTGRLNTEIHMVTPYFDKNDMPITGYAVVPITHERGDVIRDANTVEFYSGGHNMDYMEQNDAVMHDRDGNVVDMNVKREEMRQFAGAASEYPHVASWSEYQVLQERNLQRLHIDEEVKPSDYANYLDKKTREMRSGIEFIGENSTREDVARLHDSVRMDNDISDETLDAMARDYDEPEYDDF